MNKTARWLFRALESLDILSGQIFGVRNNEIFLFNHTRPVRFAHTAEGWTPDSVLGRVIPAFTSDFTPLERSGDVFSWDPM